MVTTRAQKAKALTPKRMMAVRKIRAFRAKKKGLAPMFQRGKKSYKPGNVVREVSIGKTPWVGKKILMPYRKFKQHYSNTGEFQYGPSGNRRSRDTETRLVSRRCRSKKECKAWAGKWDGKRYYKKYSREKFYPRAAALERRKMYNKSEERGGLGFIISYREARFRRKRQLARQKAAANAAAKAAKAVASRTRAASKRKRANVDPSAIVGGKRIRRQTQRYA
jgi:hypothetical protein